MHEPIGDGSEEATPAAGEEEILRELDRRLRGRVDPVVLGFLRDQEWIGDACDDLPTVGLDGAVDGLLARYKEASAFRASGREPAQPRTTREVSGDDVRGRALARIFAIDAAVDPVVKAYRAHYLPEGTIEREAVRSWVRSRRAIGLRPTGHAPRPEPGWAVGPVELITFLGPDSPWAEHVRVPPQGPLRELKLLAGRLVSRYGWIESEAVTFVLTDLPPWLPRIRVSTVERTPWTSASIIELQVSPRTSPSEVAAMYRKVRARVIGIDRRRRDMQSPERAELAVFAFEHAEGRGWREVMTAWNAREPDHSYTDVRSFTRDCHEAFRTVTGLDLEFDAVPGDSLHGT